ncbi:MAG: ATP-binding protein [Gemmatimonadales bacterium]
MEVVVQQAQSLHAVQHPGDVGEARRAAVTRAGELRFDETARGRVALIVTEAGTNLIKHAGGGHIILGGTAPSDHARSWIEVLTLDRGPGMRDVAKYMADGFSTSGTAGHGLGGMRRMSTVFDLHSDATGTVLVSRVFRDPSQLYTGTPWRVGAVCLPLHGESFAGDAWAYAWNAERAVFLIADGVGHGRLARDAAGAVIDVLRRHPELPAPELLQRANLATRGTRGAAAAVAEVSLKDACITYAAIGNTSASLLGGDGASRSMVSHHGVLGASDRLVQPFQYPWNGTGLLVMHSDGLASRWDIRRYPGLALRDPSVIAAVMYRDHARARDDVSVIVCRLATS